MCIIHFPFAVPRLQRGSPGPRPPRHRLRRVRERNTIGLGPRRAPRLQDHAQLCDEDLLRQKVNESEYRDVTAFLWIASYNRVSSVLSERFFFLSLSVSVFVKVQP